MRWGESRPDVRALVLTSSRARADGSADLLSDYDVIVFVPRPGGVRLGLSLDAGLRRAAGLVG